MTIKTERWMYHARISDGEHETWDEAAREASEACDWNTHYVERAWDTETGEERDRQWLLDRGWSLGKVQPGMRCPECEQM